MDRIANTAVAARPAATYELTVGPDPQALIERAIQALESAPLRQLLAAFMAEPQIQAVLTTTVGAGAQYERTGLCRYVVQVLRAAAETATYASAFGGSEREALYVATFIEGSRAYLGACMDGAGDADDVLRTLVREPLRRLDHQDERLAGLVRMCLGWGLPDEVDDFYVPRLRNSVKRALARAIPTATTSTDAIWARAATRSASRLSCH